MVVVVAVVLLVVLVVVVPRSVCMGRATSVLRWRTYSNESCAPEIFRVV
jgi:hypothetical protein